MQVANTHVILANIQCTPIDMHVPRQYILLVPKVNITCSYGADWFQRPLGISTHPPINFVTSLYMSIIHLLHYKHFLPEHYHDYKHTVFQSGQSVV